jgi:hypothetical protein
MYVTGKGKDFLVTCDEGGVGGDRYAAPLISNLGAKGWWVVKTKPRQLYTRDNIPGSVVHEDVWASRPVWRDTEKKNPLTPPEFKPRTVLAVANCCTYYAIPSPQ